MANKRKNVKGGAYTPSRGAYAGRTFASRRQYENQVARDRGFANKAQRNIRKRNIAFDYPSVESFNRTAQGKAATAFRRILNDGLSLSAAAREAETTPVNVRRYYGEALQRKGRTYRAVENDAAIVPMHVATIEGDRIAYVRGARDRKLVGQHAAAISRVAAYLHLSGSKRRTTARVVREIAEDELAQFRGKSIVSADGNVYELVSRLDDVKRLLKSGLLHNDSPYEDKAA